MGQRTSQFVLILATLIASWLGMQAVHELGHVTGAGLTGGRVARVVLHPLTISGTDLQENPRPSIVVWAGPVFGCLIPLVILGIAAACRFKYVFLLRFFAGFCLIANGAYIAVGSGDGVGDCGEMLRHGSPIWTLWLFGAITAPTGLWLWHGLGPHFGLGKERRVVEPGAVIASAVAAGLLLVQGLLVGGN
jgi:hypothetical protein